MLRCIVAGLILAGTCGPGARAQTLPLEAVADGVFVYHGQTALMTSENKGAIANVGFIVGAEAVAVVDTGGSLIEGQSLLRALRERTDKPIRWVINTHAHPDHIFGNGAFVGDGVVFVGHRRLAQAMALRGAHYIAASRKTMGAALDGVTLVAPALAVDTTLALDLGGRTVVLEAWPTAHSDCDLTVLDTTTGTLFGGDLVFVDHVPIVDASLLGFLSIMDKLGTLAARRVVPGHGPAVAPWPAALQAEKAYLSHLAADLRRSIREGATVAEAAASAARSERPHWSMFDDYHPGNAIAGFAELEWEAP
jgi:quinoprotein relay system zinc metallohydrolase 2